MNDINVCWTKTKKNVEITISKYLYYTLSVDNSTTPNFEDTFIFNEIKYNEKQNPYSNLSESDKKQRVEFINYLRLSFNKLTTEERKIIYWTYIDKENKYDDRFIANSLGFSLGYYYIKKKEALIRFAYSLGVEVEK